MGDKVREEAGYRDDIGINSWILRTIEKDAFSFKPIKNAITVSFIGKSFYLYQALQLFSKISGKWFPKKTHVLLKFESLYF